MRKTHSNLTSEIYPVFHRLISCGAKILSACMEKERPRLKQRNDGEMNKKKKEKKKKTSEFSLFCLINLFPPFSKLIPNSVQQVCLQCLSG